MFPGHDEFLLGVMTGSTLRDGPGSCKIKKGVSPQITSQLRSAAEQQKKMGALIRKLSEGNL
jgi:hypothetical protein